jgi:hypothetical protein
MATQSIDITGGDSVYCINQAQLEAAFNLSQQHPESSPKISAVLTTIQDDLTRNEQAALAFVLIDKLLKSSV